MRPQTPQKNKIIPAAALAVVVLCFLGVWQHLVFAAADYTARPPWQIITVTTGAVKNVILSGDDYSFVHLGVQDDAGTTSAATDRVWIMRNRDGAVSVTMDTTFVDGVKCPLSAGGSVVFSGRDVPAGADGANEIQIKATGNPAKVLIIRGRNPRE